ncbi:MAG TPA: alpha/beta hydrolase, partial [Leptospiraceae bacterium]|nr:alpha/beta hydrolase [Leptospiraceae bacterium]
ETYADVREFVMAEAKSENNKEALDEINGSRAPVASMTDEEIQENTQVLGKWLEYYYGRKYGLPDLKDFFLKSIREAPEYTFLDFIATVRAIDPFTKRNTRDLFLTDLRREVPEVKVPVYFITGEYDLMKGMGRIYFELLRAPAKQWFEVKRAGHEVSANQPEEVAKIYLEKMVAQTYSR